MVVMAGVAFWESTGVGFLGWILVLVVEGLARVVRGYYGKVSVLKFSFLGVVVGWGFGFLGLFGGFGDRLINGPCCALEAQRTVSHTVVGYCYG